MNVLSIWKLGVQIFLVLTLFLILGVTGGVSIANIKEEQRLARCTWVPVAQVTLRGNHFAIPALKHTILNFSNHRDNYGGSRIVSPALARPSDDEPLGFCDTDLAGRSDVYRVTFQRASVSTFSTDVGFLPENAPLMIILNRRPMTETNIEVIDGPADLFFPDPSINIHDGTYEPDRLRTAGWINGEHAVFSTCPRVDSRDILSSCGFRVLRRADYIEVRFIGISPDKYPVVGQTNNELVADLISKFDAVLNHFSPPKPSSD